MSPKVATVTVTDHQIKQVDGQDVRRAHHSENYIGIQRFYMRCFDTFAEICALFKTNKDEAGARLEDPGLKMEFIYAVHDAIRTFDDVRALFILVQNPVFAAQSSYSIFAHLLRLIVDLPTADHQLFVHWFKM
ncbi:putative E3 ubiquitin-protein ligase HTD2 [Homalodisca vitripennis]|nr:putative E3 ubiquitin-protein ligase HTD2 [Homalodisca vitripennis]